MPKADERIIKSARQALTFANAKPLQGVKVHVPNGPAQGMRRARRGSVGRKS